MSLPHAVGSVPTRPPVVPHRGPSSFRERGPAAEPAGSLERTGRRGHGAAENEPAKDEAPGEVSPGASELQGKWT